MSQFIPIHGWPAYNIHNVVETKKVFVNVYEIFQICQLDPEIVNEGKPDEIVKPQFMVVYKEGEGENYPTHSSVKLYGDAGEFRNEVERRIRENRFPPETPEPEKKKAEDTE